MQLFFRLPRFLQHKLTRHITDIVGSNGVIHVIDAVIMPSK